MEWENHIYIKSLERIRYKNKKCFNIMVKKSQSKYGVHSVDFLGSKFKIGYSTLTGKFQTKVGGYLTILMGLLSTAFFFIVMSQYFSKETPIVITSTESGSRRNTYDLYTENLYLPIGALVGPTGIPANQLNRYVTIKAFVDKIQFRTDSAAQAFRVSPYLSFDYRPCSEITDPHMVAHVKTLANLPGIGDLISCPDFRGLQKEFKGLMNYETFNSNTVKIKVYPCSLPDRSQCATAAEIAALSMEYGYPIKLLKPSDYRNPVEILPLQKTLRVDLRTTKIIKEDVKRNRVFDDTISLVPAKMKGEYLTLERNSIDFAQRDVTQLHCDRVEVEKGIRGRCHEYISFDYKMTSEVVVTTRSYKKLTTMLGEFGGILKIITTAAFFVYGLCSMRKVKSLMSGIIFGDGDGSSSELKKLVNGTSKNVSKVNQIGDKGRITGKGKKKEGFEALVSRFVSRRSNVDSIMEQLNLLELMSKVIFTEDEKTLAPLVLLKSEQLKIQNQKKKKEENFVGVQIFGEQLKLAKKQKNLKIT